MNLNDMHHHPKSYILKYSIPSIIAMLLTSLVTIVDGLFISNHVGKSALSALHLGLPMLYIFLGIGIMIGVGGVSLAGRALGEQHKERAINLFNQTYWTGMTLVFLLALTCSLFLLPVINWLIKDTTLQNYFIDYYRIMLIIYPFMMMNILCGMFIRAEGKPEIFMQITLIVNALNILLDYLFIERLSLGVQGAAMASGISIIVGFLSMHGYLQFKATIFHLSRFVFSIKDCWDMLYNGSSEFIGQLSMSFTNFLFNAVILKVAGINGIAALTLVGYSGYLFDMITTGFGQGISPLISYSFGAGDKSLCHIIRKQTLKMVLTVALIFYAVLTLTAPAYSRLFTSDPMVGHYTITGLRLFTLSFSFMGYNMLHSFFFTAIGNAKASAIISAARGLVIVSLAVLILPLFLGLTGIWLVAPVTEAITTCIAWYFVRQMLQLDMRNAFLVP